MKKFLFALALILGLSRSTFAQGVPIFNIGGPVQNGFGQPVTFANVTICTSGTVPAKGTNCYPTLSKVSLYSDAALTLPVPNPIISDTLGNWGPVYVAAQSLVISISGTNLTTYSFPYQAGATVGTATQVNAPQNNSLTPVQIGPNWYAGTASGVCQTPAAPTVATESTISPTGAYSDLVTYTVEVELGNRNGWTGPSPPTTYQPASGTTNAAVVQLSDYTYRSGCFKYRAFVSSNGGPFYLATAYQKTNQSIASWSRNAANMVTVTTSAAHGLIPGDYVTITGTCTGGSSTTITGSFTLIGQQASTPSTFFFIQSGNPGADSGTTGCTVTANAGLGSDSNSHMAPGDLILTAVPNSGTQPTNLNTATIDPLQVALNATCNYATNACTAGQLIVPQGTTALTTPLIVSNQQTVTGVNAPVATGKSQVTCSWADPNLGCVMVMGINNGVRVEGLSISSAGHGLMLAAWGPAYNGSNNYVRYNNITTTDTTGQFSSIYIHKGVFYDMHFENNLLNGGLADVQMDGHCGGWWFFSGSRWNGANLSASGLSTNGLLSVSSVTDPDRAQNLGAFPNGISGVEVSNLIYESGTGVIFDTVNLGFSLRDVLSADSVAISGTPALIRVGVDANAGAATFPGGDWHFENVGITGASGVATGLQFISNTNNLVTAVSVVRSALGGNPNEVDMNSVSINLFCAASYCNTYEGATGHKIINQPTAAAVQVVGGFNSGVASAYGSMQQLLGSTTYKDFSNKANFWHGCWGTGCAGGATYVHYWGDFATATNYAIDESFGTGYQVRWFENDGATPLVVFNARSGANQINLCGGTPANGKVNIGCPLVSQSTGQFTGTETTVDGTAGSNQSGGSSACETSYGITTLSGASTTTGQTCLPANAIIDAVVYRITTTITTATSFTIGDSGSATRYCGTQSTLTAGTTGLCLAAGYYLNSSALGVKITPSTSPGAGAMRIIVYYHTWVAPTS